MDIVVVGGEILRSCFSAGAARELAGLQALAEDEERSEEDCICSFLEEGRSKGGDGRRGRRRRERVRRSRSRWKKKTRSSRVHSSSKEKKKMPQSPSKSRPPPLSPAQASRRRQRSSFVTGALAGGSAVALLALMALASSRAGSDSGGGAWGSDGSGGSGGEPFSSSSRRFPPSSPDPWVPNSALRASASAQVTAAAVQALRESGALRASKGSSMPWSSAKKTTTAKEAKATKRTKKNKKPSTTTQKHPPRPVLPSSLNGLAALALDGDGGDVEAATVSESSNSQLLPPRASVVVPLLTDREAKGAAATALSAAAAFDNDNVDGDDENSSSSSSSLEIIIVAADAEVARSLTGTSAETQAGVRLIVRDAAAARIAGQRRKEEEEVEEGSEDGSDETDETETSSSSSSSSSSRHFLRRSPPPPLLPPRLPQLGGSGAGDAALRNAGARAARSEDLLVFLKPGVTLRKGYWRALFSSAKAHPKAQFFFSGRQPSPSLTEADSEDWAKRLPWHNPYAFNRAFAIRRRSWVEAGGFSPAAVPGTDVEALLLSALDAPPRIERLDAKGDLVKEENAGPSGKGSIANSGVREGKGEGEEEEEEEEKSF